MGGSADRGGWLCRRGAEPQAETGALPGRALTVNRAFVLAHDAVGDREAEAGALSGRFRREERVVDPREMLGENALAGVRDLGDDIRAVDARGDAEPPAAGHRVAGVEQQVEEDLLQLELVADEHQRRRRQLAAHLDAALLELMFEQRQHVADHGVEIDRLAFHLVGGVGP